MKKTMLILTILFSQWISAQDSTQTTSEKPFTISAYAEAYYSYDFNRPSTNARPAFLYNFNRHNEFNINLAMVKLAYATGRVRANIALGAGSYMNANYAAEPATLKNVYEATAGYSLSAKNNLSIDVGVLPSHIGFESAIGKDNWTVTRSILAENTPYFEGGARLSYTTGNNKLQLAALALNGWQRITRVEGNSLVSFGTQINFKPSDKLTFNYSSFFGSDKPDTNRLWRYFHNLYAILQLSKSIGLITGFDMGMEQKNGHNRSNNKWYSPIGILRFTPAEKWGIALRGEYYSDKKQVIIATGTPGGFATAGYSLNLDYSPEANVALRVEGRVLHSKDKIFLNRNEMTKNDAAVTFSTAIAI